MSVPNVMLRGHRERMPSRVAPGESMSRAELAWAVNDYLWRTTGRRYQLDAHTVARYERGAVRWPSAHYRSGLRHVLGVHSDAELGFRPTPRGNTHQATESRRSLSTPSHPVSTGLVGDQPARFLNDTTVDTPIPARIGWSEVAHVRATTRAVAMSENLFGGGLSCEAALAQLRWAGKLLEARAVPEVYRAVAEAVGNLAGVVAFSAFDIANHTAAERCFTFALWCADQGESWQLRANTLADMARKASYLGDPDTALSLIEFAQVRMDRLTATARAMLCAIRAYLLSITGRHAETRDEIAQADAQFELHDPGADPPWLCYYGTAEHQGSTGKALIPLARADDDPDAATARLHTAIRLQGSDYPRSRAFSRTRLASLLLTTGNPHEAVPIGHHAAEETAQLHSHRLTGELASLSRVAARYSDIADITELRQHIDVVTSPAS